MLMRTGEVLDPGSEETSIQRVSSVSGCFKLSAFLASNQHTPSGAKPSFAVLDN